jgi:hypothetical protein
MAFGEPTCPPEAYSRRRIDCQAHEKSEVISFLCLLRILWFHFLSYSQARRPGYREYTRGGTFSYGLRGLTRIEKLMFFFAFRVFRGKNS